MYILFESTIFSLAKLWDLSTAAHIAVGSQLAEKLWDLRNHNTFVYKTVDLLTLRRIVF